MERQPNRIEIETAGKVDEFFGNFDAVVSGLTALLDRGIGRLQRLICQQSQRARKVTDNSPALCRHRLPRSPSDKVYSHYEFPLFFDGDGERVTAALHCYTKAVDDPRPRSPPPGFGRGLVADFGCRAALTLHCDN